MIEVAVATAAVVVVRLVVVRLLLSVGLITLGNRTFQFNVICVYMYQYTCFTLLIAERDLILPNV